MSEFKNVPPDTIVCGQQFLLLKTCKIPENDLRGIKMIWNII